MADRSPVRVVLDGELRLPLESRLVATAHQVALWIITGEMAPKEREQALVQAGAEVLRVRSTNGKLELGAALGHLAGRGITRLMVETGPILAAAFVNADLVDEAMLFRSPTGIGPDGIDALEGLPIDTLTRRLTPVGSEAVGPDIVEDYERR
jgi:diaminohydroxyphosphoribosylaminopyrimidine deaminase / 5-amino-6-(5-phosphoribosylamino)uracil reductase